MGSDANAIVLLSIALGAITTIYYYNKGAFALLQQKDQQKVEHFVDNVAKNIVSRLTVIKPKKPILWFVVDDFGTNNRRWIDFGARSSRDLNMGFLSVTKARCMFTQGADFDVRVCLGRASVAQVLYEVGGVVPDNHMSVVPSLWRAWARSALLSYCGGLYFDGLGLCLGPSFLSSVLGKEDAVFGTEHDEPRTSALDGSCSPFTGWASGPKHAAWSALNADVVDLVNAGPTAWTSAVIRNQVSQWYNKHLRNAMPTLRFSEWSRRRDGRPIEIEDLFGRSYSNLSDEFLPGENAVYLPLDYEIIDRSVTYKWFLSLSAESIVGPDSKFLWASLSQNIRR